MTTTEQEDFTELARDPEATALVKKGIVEILKPRAKLTLADLFQTVLSPKTSVVSKSPPVPQKLSEDVLDAIARLPEVFGKTIVTVDRALTNKELATIVEERQVIDKVMSVLKTRKDDSIREVLANHMDAKIPEDQREGMRTDAKGHFAPWETQEVEVEGTDMKVQRYASGGKPNLTIQAVEDLHEEGLIDRPTYLTITKKPDLPRVLDEDGLHKAIQKNPGLFFLLATKAEAAPPTTTIKVQKA
jgi:hypothetical protein